MAHEHEVAAEHGPAPIPFVEQVGLVMRAFRRARGLSQRALAASLGLPQSTVARLERSADGTSVATLLEVLARTGHTIGIVDDRGELVTEWESTDLEARDRSGRRFPAHREVRPVQPDSFRPVWWVLAEYFSGGTQPRWTAEGFEVPEGTRFGREPRPRRPGEPPRFPDGEPHLP